MEAMRFIRKVNDSLEGEGDCPTRAFFEIEEDTARRIVYLAQLVEREGLSSVEQYDYRVDYGDPGEDEPDDAEYDGVGLTIDLSRADEPRTDCDRLVVYRDSFWFSAYLKSTAISLETDPVYIKEVAAHFGIPFGTSTTKE